MDKPSLIMTVGLPRSGKSTWAKQQNFPIVNPDSIRLALHGQDFIAEAEPWVWTIAKTMVNSLFLAGHNCVILDATNIMKRRRNEWISSKWNRQFVVFPTSLEECINRADKTKPELIPVIKRMNKNFENVEQSELKNNQEIISFITN
jgi:predicted kinase